MVHIPSLPLYSVYVVWFKCCDIVVESYNKVSNCKKNNFQQAYFLLLHNSLAY